jgi:hypothetical protein
VGDTHGGGGGSTRAGGGGGHASERSQVYRYQEVYAFQFWFAACLHAIGCFSGFLNCKTDQCLT